MGQSRSRPRSHGLEDDHLAAAGNSLFSDHLTLVVADEGQERWQSRFASVLDEGRVCFGRRRSIYTGLAAFYEAGAIGPFFGAQLGRFREVMNDDSRFASSAV